MQLILVALGLLLVGPCYGADLPPQECPNECTCYYFRIHWVAECSYRGLTSVPPSGLSPQTYVLDLKGNRLSALSLPANVRPRRLLLANNYFRKLQRQHFQGLNLLLDVDLSDNKLSSIEADAFHDSPGLISLQFRGNPQLKEPSDSNAPFLVSRTLQSLELADCGITKVGEGFFRATSSLRKIDLSGNPLTTVEDGAFSGLSGLDEVRLSRTKITHISSAFPLDAPLRIMDLSDSKISSSDLAALLSRVPHLEHLDVSDVRMALTTVNHGTAFFNLPWLQELNLAGNNLGALDMTQALGKLSKLESLDLSYCNLNSESFNSAALLNLTRLRTLKLSGNTLNALNMTALMEYFSKLHTLTLRNCSLGTTGFLRELIPLRQSLRALDLADNPLGNDEVNAAGSIFPLLESLDVSCCRLTRVTRSAFSSATNLVNLAISGNPFSQLETGALSSLTKLEHLHMENCGVKGAPGADVFPPGQQAPLRELRMAGNPLRPDTTSFIPQHLSGLTLLDVSRAGINRLPASAIRYAANLEKLIVADNSLESVDSLPANLGSLAPKLHKLDVRRCKLKTLNPTIFTGTDKLSKVYLTGNPWKCNCGLEGFWRWATSRGVALQEKGGEDTLKCDDTQQTWAVTLNSLNCA